jgi:hypothetical protein
MPHYKATKDFDFGALRLRVQAGEVLEHDGTNIHLRGNSQPFAGLTALLDGGFIVPSTTTSTALVKPTAAPAPPPVQSAGPVPAHTNPDKAHQWGSPDFGSTSKVCRVCGVELVSSGGITGNIQADRKNLKYQYRDAYGVFIESMHELPCPVFIGQLGGAVAGTTHRVRKLTNRVETIDERVARLEQENAALRELTEQRQVEALELLRRLTQATEQLAVEARPALPDHSQIIDAFDVIEEAEVVLVKSVEEEVDELLSGVPLD